MKISYAITACNEVEETIRLVNQLLNYKGENSEIVVLLDTPKAPTELIEYLELQGEANHINLIESEFGNDFAQWKNLLNSQCNGEWIFQLDADETISEYLIKNIAEILEMNPDVDLIYIPRINTVEGLTQEDVNSWGWRVNENGYINYPDYQGRVYRQKMGWYGKVHERIIGGEKFATLPIEEIYCIQHHKTIAKQEKQNNFYKTL